MKQSGLTLIEVMVALFIFAVTGTAVMKAAGDHLNSVGQIEQITFATWVANNRLTDVMVQNTWPPRNNQRGSEEMAGRTWYWQQNVLQTNDEDLRAVEVSVGLDSSFSDTITTVITYVARPTETPGSTDGDSE